ncbi:hypothetical protein JMJ35_005830 [Cladonia borealis]|uniref:Uncharacterized protein n=1 Tax=Cladonia borealis TaxID=184061 RepID=A0AA39V0R9_9LECA|nr:hypothetical protein JMJ35_005830 [Cladonia borealis]
MATSPELCPVIISLRVDRLQPPVFFAASWTQWKLETLGYSFQRSPTGDRVFIFWKHTFVEPGEHLFIFSKRQKWFVDADGFLAKDEFGRTCNLVRVRKPNKNTLSEAGVPDGDEIVDDTNDTCGWVDTAVPLCVRSLRSGA